MKFFEKIMVDEYLSQLNDGLDEAPIAAKGWTMKSIEKFEKTIGKKADEHGFFDVCVSRMKSEMGERAKGFCASIKDAKYNSTYWRNKKSKEEIKKATEKHPSKKPISKK